MPFNTMSNHPHEFFLKDIVISIPYFICGWNGVVALEGYNQKKKKKCLIMFWEIW